MLEEKYKGLNLPDLMELMHDIVRPDSVSMLPQTVGWWILLGWLVFCLALGVLMVWRRWMRNRYRREAMTMLNQIQASTDGLHYLQAVQAADLVKRTALAVFPRSAVASLTGDQWAAFLCQSSDNHQQVVSGSRDLVAAPYREGINVESALSAARAWIEYHNA